MASTIDFELERELTKGEIKDDRLLFTAKLLDRERRLQEWLKLAGAGEFPVKISVERSGAVDWESPRDVTVQKPKKKDGTESYRLNLGKGALAGLVAPTSIMLRFHRDGTLVVGDAPKTRRAPEEGDRTRRGTGHARRGESSTTSVVVIDDPEFRKLLHRAKSAPQHIQALGDTFQIKLLAPSSRPREPGSARGLVRMSDDFDAPMDEEGGEDRPA